MESICSIINILHASKKRYEDVTTTRSDDTKYMIMGLCKYKK